MLGKALTTAAAGNAAGEGTYVEDVFSTYLYPFCQSESIQSFCSQLPIK